MTQLLFGLTVVFVMYVLYEVFKTVSQTGRTPPPAAESMPPAEEAATSPPVSKERDKSATAAIRPAVEGERGATLRNPATGEISPVPTNYRFAKKWIKEALVAEGLLDRIYKPNELDEATSEKVREALDKFKFLDKYQV